MIRYRLLPIHVIQVRIEVLQSRNTKKYKPGFISTNSNFIFLQPNFLFMYACAKILQDTATKLFIYRTQSLQSWLATPNPKLTF